MKMMSFVNRTVSLNEQQNYALENWKWKHRASCSKIMRFLIDYYIENPVKLKEIIKEGKKNEKKK